MDDILSGADNEEDAVELSQTLIHIQVGGFLLREGEEINMKALGIR